MLYEENYDIYGYVREYEGKSLPKAIFDEDRILFEGQGVKDKLSRRVFGPLDEELRAPEKLNVIVPIWGKLYKADIIKNIDFVSLEELGLCEDGYFHL